MIRIAIVNDVRMAAETLRRIVVSLANTEVAWIAEDGQQSVDKCRADRPDLILMDLIMPVMNGVEATRRIMLESPCPILVVTATVSGNRNEVFEALGHGALDAVNTPVVGRDGNIAGATELLRKIRNIVLLRQGRAPGLKVTGPTTSDPVPARLEQTAPILAIGASTGGPQALATVLRALGEVRSFSVVVVQHLDQYFVPGLCDWLTRETNRPVQHIQPGQRPTAGTIHIAGTPDHLVLTPSGVFQYTRDPLDIVYRPSVDVFFDSLIKARVRPGVALLLTGMGRDGAAGMKALRLVGWKTIAQDQATSVVWGMPGAAVQLQAADRVLPLSRIAPAITEFMNTIRS